MNRTRTRKLTLHRDTLRRLDATQLGGIAGADSGSLSCTGPDCGGGGDATAELTSCIECVTVTLEP